MYATARWSVKEGRDGLRLQADPEDPEFMLRLWDLAATRPERRWYLDLGGAESLGNEVLVDLLALDQALRVEGGRLSLRNVSPLVYEMFHICRVLGIGEVNAASSPADYALA